MRSENTPNDQAQRLRQLAHPSALPERTPLNLGKFAGPSGNEEEKVCIDGGRKNTALANAPHVVLISELPSLNGGLTLALSIAEQLCQQQLGTLLIDLAPSASHLPRLLKNHARLPCDTAPQVHPLWTPSHHGRVLADWAHTQERGLSVVAQPVGEFPTAEQMPRLCEQLIRRIGNPRASESMTLGMPHQQVLLVSECVGLPLDSACWQSADTILLLHDADTEASQIESVLTARLPNKTCEQRIVLLRKQTPKLKHWALKRWRVPCTLLHPPQRRTLLPQIPHVECWDVVWPYGERQPGRARSSRSTQTVDSEILQVLWQDMRTRDGRNRQAS